MDSISFHCFTVVKSFTTWYALLLLLVLRFSSISLHCSPIQFSFVFFMHLLMSLFPSLYFSDPSASNRFVLSCLLLSHRSRISAVAPVINKQTNKNLVDTGQNTQKLFFLSSLIRQNTNIFEGVLLMKAANNYKQYKNKQITDPLSVEFL